MFSNQITKEYLNKFSYKEMVPLKCRRCSSDFLKLKTAIQNHLRRGRNIYCSRSCNSHARNEKHNQGSSIVVSEWCDVNFKKSFAEIKKTQHSFCGHSCAANWRNANKKTGCRRSKLEIYLENKIHNEYPNLFVKVNSRSSIGFELDLFFPDIMLACEINGIFHYKPIYGNTKFKRTQEIDEIKKERCKNQNIELLVIENIFKAFNDSIGEQCWVVLNDAILKKTGQ